MADDYFQGRRPSFGFHGQLRGFRSRPGAPMAQPNLNQTGRGYGETPRGITPPSNWESLFRNSVTGANTATGKASPLPGGGQDDAGALGAAGPIGGSDQPPSLETMANGGMTHAQKWSQPVGTGVTRGTTPNPLAGTGYETGDPNAILSKYQTPNTATMSYGWNDSFANPTNG